MENIVACSAFNIDVNISIVSREIAYRASHDPGRVLDIFGLLQIGGTASASVVGGLLSVLDAGTHTARWSVCSVLVENTFR